MGGGSAPQQTPIPIHATQPLVPQQPGLLQPAPSMKGGTLAGIPNLQTLFGAPQSGAPVFPPSQSFPWPQVSPPAAGGLAVNPLAGGQPVQQRPRKENDGSVEPVNRVTAIRKER